MHLKKYAAALAVIAVVVSGCGGNSDEATAKKSLAKKFQAESTVGFTLTSKQATCTANSLVDNVGVKDLQKSGILTKKFTAADSNLSQVKMSKSDANAAASAIVECTDAVKMLTKSMSSQGVDATTAACIEKVLTKKVVTELFAALFRGDQAAMTQMLTAPLSKCAVGG